MCTLNFEHTHGMCHHTNRRVVDCQMRCSRPNALLIVKCAVHRQMRCWSSNVLFIAKCVVDRQMRCWSSNALLIVKCVVNRQKCCERVSMNTETFCRVAYSGGMCCTCVPCSSVAALPMLGCLHPNDYNPPCCSLRRAGIAIYLDSTPWLPCNAQLHSPNTLHCVKPCFSLVIGWYHSPINANTQHYNT